MAEKSLQLLAHGVRWPVIGKYLGQLWLMLAVLTLVPTAAGLIEGEMRLAIGFALVVALLAVAGWLLRRLPVPRNIQVNEAMVVVALVFVLSPPLLALPLAFEGMPFIDAWFETVSGLTTTGLSTLPTVEDRSATFLLTRAWTQWYGGLGIAILSVALFLPHHLGARRLAEVGGDEPLQSTAHTHGVRVVRVYVLLTLAAIVILGVLSGDWFDGLVRALAALSTGGFSMRDNSLAGVVHGLQVGVMIAMLLGAICLPLYDRAWRKGPGELLSDPELRTLMLMSVLTGLLVWASIALNGADRHWDPLDMAFIAVSAQTTTGFSTVDPASLPDSAKLVLCLSMLFGGGVGSTAGGIKLLRLLILIRLVQLWMQRSCLPTEAVTKPRLGRHAIEQDDVAHAGALLLLFVAITLCGWWLFVVAGHAPVDALFEVVSAVCTVGLSVGITGPELPASLKVLLILLMTAGRVEIMALLILLYPRTWFARRNHST